MVASAIGLPNDQAERLLMLSRWNPVETVQKYISDAKQLREDAGLAPLSDDGTTVVRIL